MQRHTPPPFVDRGGQMQRQLPPSTVLGPPDAYGAAGRGGGSGASGPELASDDGIGRAGQPRLEPLLPQSVLME